MNQLKKILDTRNVGLICFLFALANRIIFTSLNSLIGTDTKIQLTYTENLLAGKGMGVTKYFTNNLELPFYDTHLFFPPGFSLAIIPFLKLSGGDEFKAVLAFDILTAILFVISVRYLGKKIGLSPAFNNIMTLIAGCSQYVFFTSWSSTDVIGLALVLFAFTEIIDVVAKQEKISLQKIISYGLLFCLPYFFRYMYLPIALVLPSLILILGIAEKRKQLKVTGCKLLVSTVFFLLVLFGITLLISGNTIHINNSGRGVFFEQAVHWYPFIPASFINLDFAAQLTAKIPSIEYSNVMRYFELINFFLFGVLVIALWFYIKNHQKNLAVSSQSVFIVGGSAISITIILLLAYLTLTYKELDWAYTSWTFSIDERYFAFMYVFMPMLFLCCLYHYHAFFKKPFLRLIAIIALLFLTTEILHGVYYNIKIISDHKDLASLRN
ncbi:MAG TPA: hypothetical protein VJU52_04470, partial [Flavobacterium sp.]|nr:hypothetical protein [Flavobacterium sp.]